MLYKSSLLEYSTPQYECYPQRIRRQLPGNGDSPRPQPAGGLGTEGQPESNKEDTLRSGLRIYHLLWFLLFWTLLLPPTAWAIPMIPPRWASGDLS